MLTYDRSMHRYATMIIIFFFLNGCVLLNRYEYTVPASEHGKHCVSQCLAQKQQCELTIETLYNQCRTNQARIANEAYNTALHDYYIKKKINPASAVFEPTKPYESSSSCHQSSLQCSDYYDQCFKLCGGTITLIKD